MAVRRNQPSNNGSESDNEALDTIRESLGADFLGNDTNDGSDTNDGGDGGDDELDLGGEQNDRRGTERKGGDQDDDDGADGVGDQRLDQDDRRGSLDDLSGRGRVSHTEGRNGQLQDQGRRPLPKRAEVRADRKGNLVDVRDPTKIIAPAGPAARFYMDAQKLRRDFTSLEDRSRAAVENVTSRLTRAIEIATQVDTELTTLKAQNKAISDLGLDHSELLEAASLAAESKRDPMGAIRKVLTRAAARGINITELGAAGAGFDSKAFMDIVKSEIQKATNPLTQHLSAEDQRRKADTETAQSRGEVEREVNTFFAINQDAKKYMGVFQRLMQDPQTSHMSLDHMWDRIQLNLARNGRGIRQDDTRGRGDMNSPQRRSLPRGRSQVDFSGDTENQDEMAPISTSYDDIVGSVLKKYNVGRMDV